VSGIEKPGIEQHHFGVHERSRLAVSMRQLVLREQQFACMFDSNGNATLAFPSIDVLTPAPEKIA